jgi:hypothetical protein
VVAIGSRAYDARRQFGLRSGVIALQTVTNDAVCENNVEHDDEASSFLDDVGTHEWLGAHQRLAAHGANVPDGDG